MQQTVQQLAALVQGQVHGDGNRVIEGARPVSEAQSGDITFVENEQYARMINQCRASAVVVPQRLVARLPDLVNKLPAHVSAIQVSDALSAFVTIAKHLKGQAAERPHGIDPRALVDESAQVGPESSIHAFAVVGVGSVLGARCRLYPGAVVGRNCRLGDDVTLYPHAVLYDDTVLGDRVTIHANAVIGSDGFGYRLQEGKYVKVPQLGRVEIAEDVEIGACTTIDRGTFQPTRIGAGTKIDNQVMIGHNCQIGQHNVLVSQVGIAGSCKTGDYVVMAGQVGLSDHLTIGERAMIGPQAGLARDVAPGQRVMGTPGRPESEAMRIFATSAHLPAMRRDIKMIKQHLGLADSEKAAG